MRAGLRRNELVDPLVGSPKCKRTECPHCGSYDTRKMVVQLDWLMERAHKISMVASHNDCEGSIHIFCSSMRMNDGRRRNQVRNKNDPDLNEYIYSYYVTVIIELLAG